MNVGGYNNNRWKTTSLEKKEKEKKKKIQKIIVPFNTIYRHNMYTYQYNIFYSLIICQYEYMVRYGTGTRGTWCTMYLIIPDILIHFYFASFFYLLLSSSSFSFLYSIVFLYIFIIIIIFNYMHWLYKKCR